MKLLKSKNRLLAALMVIMFTMNIFAQDSEDKLQDVLEEDVYINLKYTACYQGRHCPRFEITILGNGTVVFKGIADVFKVGVFQKQIEKEKIADLLMEFLQIQYFERKDENTSCYKMIKLMDGGNYKELDSICITSNHGPFTDIEARFGSKERQVNLEQYFSNDYVKIRQKIIETADVQNFIESELHKN